MKNRGSQFTHFASLPFIEDNHRKHLQQLQSLLTKQMSVYGLENCLEPNNPNLFHLTLSMLTLPQKSQQQKLIDTLAIHEKQLKQIMGNTTLTTGQIKYFTRPNYKNKNSPNFINVIYLDLVEDQNYKKINTLVDVFIRLLLKEEIIVSEELKSMNISYDHNSNLFKNEKLHITLFRCKGLLEDDKFLQAYHQRNWANLYQGKKLECNYIDVSTRFAYDETNFYKPLYRILLNQFEEKE